MDSQIHPAKTIVDVSSGRMKEMKEWKEEIKELKKLKKEMNQRKK